MSNYLFSFLILASFAARGLISIGSRYSLLITFLNCERHPEKVFDEWFLEIKDLLDDRLVHWGLGWVFCVFLAEPLVPRPPDYTWLSTLLQFLFIVPVGYSWILGMVMGDSFCDAIERARKHRTTSHPSDHAVPRNYRLWGAVFIVALFGIPLLIPSLEPIIPVSLVLIALLAALGGLRWVAVAFLPLRKSWARPYLMSRQYRNKRRLISLGVAAVVILLMVLYIL